MLAFSFWGRFLCFQQCSHCIPCSILLALLLPPPSPYVFLFVAPTLLLVSFCLFSCRLFPFNNKMNPVIDQRIAFPNPLSITSTIAFLKVLQWASYLGKSLLCIILLCFSHLSFSSDNSLDIIFSLHLPQELFLPPPPRLPLVNLLFPAQDLSGLISIIQKLGQTELHRNGRDRRNKCIWE